MVVKYAGKVIGVKCGIRLFTARGKQTRNQYYQNIFIFFHGKFHFLSNVLNPLDKNLKGNRHPSEMDKLFNVRSSKTSPTPESRSLSYLFLVEVMLLMPYRYIMSRLRRTLFPKL